MNGILKISAKLATLDPVKVKGFWNKGYHVIISVYEFTKKILSRKPSYIQDLLMWPKFGNSSISIREVMETIIL